MNDRQNTLNVFAEYVSTFLKPIVRQAVEDALTDMQTPERLLDTEEAARLLAVSEDWLYRHAKRLPFSRKLGPKMLRFSYQGIQKYLAAKTPR